jgi:site-specific recombinase XerD
MLDKEYQKYERACKKIRAENAKLLADFDQWLSKKGLTQTTIECHLEYVEFYLNAFLLYSDAIPAKKGSSKLSSFLGDWFIRKTMWASPTSTRQIAASLKKFYTFMHEQEHIGADDLQDLKKTIKEEMPDWLAALGRCDDSDITDPLDIWGP